MDASTGSRSPSRRSGLSNGSTGILSLSTRWAGLSKGRMVVIGVTAAVFATLLLALAIGARKAGSGSGKDAGAEGADLGNGTEEDPSMSRTWMAAPRPTLLEKYGCTQLQMIHVGKTGGTSAMRWFGHLLKEAPPEMLPEGEPLLMHPHNFKLGMAEHDTDCYAFFIRDPVERFVSGYYSHYRKLESLGLKRGMNKEKAWALHRFADVGELAEAFSSSDPRNRTDAYKVYNTLGHLHGNFKAYLPNLNKHISKILFVGVMTRLNDDFLAMLRAAGYPTPSDGVYWDAVHQDPESKATKKDVLTAQGRRNLQHLLEDDYAIMHYLYRLKMVDVDYSASLPGQPDLDNPQDDIV